MAWDDLGLQPKGWLYPVTANSETGKGSINCCCCDETMVKSDAGHRLGWRSHEIHVIAGGYWFIAERNC